jgi:putative ABC transport system permease protein
MKRARTNPPKFMLKFFEWFCHPDLHPYIEGDLMQYYNRRVKNLGQRKADLHFIVDVIRLFRPGIIRPIGQNKMNHTTMLKSHFTIGWRNLTRNKAYSVINIAGLALSMSCAILIFVLVQHHLRFDNFHSDSDRIYRVVTELHRDVIAYQSNVPSPLGKFIRTEQTFAEKVGRIYTEEEVLITLRSGDNVVKFSETKGVAFTEPEFFDIFNFPLVHGQKSTALSEPNTAIITESTRRKYFGEKDAIGETLWLRNRTPLTITGILKDLPSNTDIDVGIFASFSTLQSVDPWMADDIGGWGGIRDGMKCYVVLKPNASPGAAEALLAPYVKRFRPKSKNVHHYKLQPLADVHFNALYGGAMEKRNLWILAIVGTFLIVTACVNFVNLATAQALRRSKEVGVRKVLGSMKLQLFSQFILETALITFFGIALAVMLAYSICPSVNALFNLQLSVNIFTNSLLLLFIVGLTVAVTLLAGYYPSMVLSGFKPVTALKGKVTQQQAGGFNTRRTLIVSQFAISQVLIIGMIVIMNQLRFARTSDLGFEKDAIVMVSMGESDNPGIANTLKGEFARIPGIEQVSLCFAAPADDNEWGNSIRFDNDPEEVNFRTSIKMADADYLDLFDLDLAAGRNVTPSDTVREMIVNEALVRKLGLASPEEALGKMVAANGGSMKGPIVGVLKDFHDKSFHQEISAILLTTYLPDYEYYAVKLNLAEARSSLAAIEKLWVAHHPDQMFEAEFLDDRIAQFYETEATILKLIQIVSFIAIFIGALGLFGLVSFMVAQKTKEVGIRKVLGGSVQHILWLFGKEFVRLIMVAFMIAAPIGWWAMSTWLQDFKFQIDLSPWMFLLAIGSSLFIAACTVSYQVITTALMNPVTSLRAE